MLAIFAWPGLTWPDRTGWGIIALLVVFLAAVLSRTIWRRVVRPCARRASDFLLRMKVRSIWESAKRGRAPMPSDGPGKCPFCLSDAEHAPDCTWVAELRRRKMEKVSCPPSDTFGLPDEVERVQCEAFEPRFYSRGQQYFLGGGAQCPVLKPLLQPLFDTEYAPNRGAVFGSFTLNFFSDNRKFSTGDPKGCGDTNMGQPGCLGYPNEFIPRAIRIVLPEDSELARAIFEHGVLEFIRGQNVPFLRIPVRAMQPYFQVEQSSSSPWKEIRDALLRFAKDGGHVRQLVAPLSKNGVGMSRIDPCESFRVDLRYEGPPVLTPSARVTVLLDGILLAQVM